MPPAKNDGCRYDDSEFKRRVGETLWHSDNSHSNRIKELETEAKAQRRLLTLWLPIIFGFGTSGLFFLLQIIVDRFLK